MGKPMRPMPIQPIVCVFVAMPRSRVPARHSGAPRSGEPGIQIEAKILLDSGLAVGSPRPGMTSVLERVW
jgi:hypothetical protein